MSTLGRLAIIVAMGALLIAGAAWYTGFGWNDLQHIGQPRNVLEISGQTVRIPAAEGPAQRQAAEVPVTTAGNYEFMFVEGGQPTRYDPCRRVEWVLNPEGMPEGAEELVHRAVDDVAWASGLVFDYQGETDEPARFNRDIIQDRYGEQFAPIVVGWANEQQVPDLAGSVTGLGGSSSVNGPYGDQRYLEAGVVIMDNEDVADLMESHRGSALATAVIMHEFAHVIGLAHVEDPSELMNHENSTLVTWGPGDLAGLAIAGAGPCQ